MKRILIMLVLPLLIFACNRREEQVRPDVVEILTSREWRTQDGLLYINFDRNRTGWYSDGSTFTWQYGAEENIVYMDIQHVQFGYLEQDYRIINITPDRVSFNIFGNDDFVFMSDIVVFLGN